MDSTNYFLEHGAASLAALRLWAESRQKTDADLRALIDSANAATLEDIAEELAKSHSPDELRASVQLEGIAYETPPVIEGDQRLAGSRAWCRGFFPRSDSSERPCSSLPIPPCCSA